MAASDPRVHAGLLRRYAAGAVDAAILFAVWAPAAFEISGRIPVIGVELLAAIAFLLLAVVYFVVMESVFGASGGKWLMGIKVVGGTGARATVGQAVGRNLGKLVTLTTLGLGFLLTAVTRQRRALHDIMSGTLVVSRHAPPASIPASMKTMRLSFATPVVAAVASGALVLGAFTLVKRLSERADAEAYADRPFTLDELANRPGEPAPPIPLRRMQGGMTTDAARVVIPSESGPGGSAAGDVP
jgi:uncharacterized RDD family membrane protein YckC